MDLRFIKGPAGTMDRVLPGVTAIKTGGHFPGSLVLHWEQKLFIADTLWTVPVSTILSQQHLLPLPPFFLSRNLHPEPSLLTFSNNESPPTVPILVLLARQPSPSNGPFQT